MKQSIQLRLGQNLTMTPQLQQAIRLLQLSTLDLQTEIQSILDSNMMLEVDEDNDSPAERDNEARDAADSGNGEASREDAELNQADSNDNIPDDLPVDSAWDDIYDGSTSYSAPAAGDDRPEAYELYAQGGESLQEHLSWQLEMSPFSDNDRAIALALIDAIDEDGYLTTTLEDIHQGLAGDEGEIELDEVEAVLHRIQRFDPVGVGARTPSECLLVQLQQLPDDTPHRSAAMALVKDHLELLGNRDFASLMRQLKLKEEALKEVISLIQTLNPHPGSTLPGTAPEYVVPDVIVKKVKGSWRVELNPDIMPKLRINHHYAGLIRRIDNSADSNTLRNHLQEARWFLKSLQSRNETLLKVARCIVERQRGFFDYGDEAMKPLVLRDVAEAVEMHESTISRVTTQKYMHTPRGIYEFKYFFSSHVSTSDGGECSATAIRAIIKKLIASESPSKPLSDSKIADILLKQGIKVARRTVAKYREAMSIAPSNERKRLA